MDAEGLFSIVFILVLLSIPFGLGFHLWKSIRTRKDIESLYAAAACRSGRVVGYTETAYDPDIVGEHYIVVEYTTDRNEPDWAEAGGHKRADYPVNSAVYVMCDPQDARRVMIVHTRAAAQLGVRIEKNLGLVINLVFTALILASVYQYHALAPDILAPFFASYVAGMLCGAMMKKTGVRDGTWALQERRARHNRMEVAQRNGDVPCYLKE